jgi:hypothetical protein
MFCPPEFGTGFKYGFYVLKYKNHLDKFTIFRRHRYPGYFYTSQDDICHFDIIIAKGQNDKSIKKIEKNDKFCCMILMNKCLQEIDENFIPSPENDPEVIEWSREPLTAAVMAAGCETQNYIYV